MTSSFWDGLANAFQTTAFAGPMLLAVPVAVVAGLVSFASPCVIPLLPGYFAFISGMTGAHTGPRAKTMLLAGVALFVLGFSAVFVLLGVAFGSLGLALRPWQDVITPVLGIAVVIMGLSFLGWIPSLQRERRFHVVARGRGLWGAPVLGIAFGLGWAPCIGPTLATVLSLSLDQASAPRGAVLAAAYATGLGIPFLLIALLAHRSTAAVTFLRVHRVAVMRLGGALLVLIGLALVTGMWGRWTQSLQSLIGGFVTVI
ncbi:cytochrome c biogenesis CcdA family protein [Cellulomonas marina]|uniref:Cytochrome c-type biogenesis protein n=1 Tax=Cellulomonas marina TaxID=988821 RepID=A0A1I0YWP3_9CELL|nr:cytochrome c biogenesis CcdA family protein [Cellulomonas marina]GIG28075.1 cytochrome C biogenesis protein CcdA [Cellulomonas marina]SFB17809.1 cytochrome c-type biogenesis protein [Cellulomonas marina]